MARATFPFVIIALAAAASGTHGSDAGRSPSFPVIIAHRGASGYRPEHTLAAYELAIDQGADFIEPDIVPTKDFALVARHENEISSTTDVLSRPEFAGRRAKKTIDGVEVSGFFTEDFTLAELKTLRAKERLPALRAGSATYDGQFEIPTLQEILDLARRKSGPQAVGVYPEVKHPSYFRGLGLALEEPLIAALHAAGFRGTGAAACVQSFEVASLVRLRRLTELRLVQLIDDRGAPYDFVAASDARTFSDLTTPAGLAGVRAYADGIGANKSLLVPASTEGDRLTPSTLLEDAHRAGLFVHAWTFRAENEFLPAGFRDGGAEDATYRARHGDAAAEAAFFFALGVDGIFTDHPDIAVAARKAFTPQFAPASSPSPSRR